MRSLQREGELPVRRAVKRHAELEQVAHALRPVFSDQPRHDGIDDAGAGGDGVGRVERRRIFRRQCSCKAALRPGGSCSLAQGGERDDCAPPRRKL